MRHLSLSLALCAASLAACSDAATAPPPSNTDPRFAMAQEARAAADTLYDLAVQGDSAGQTYRPMLLRALVDGLQWGSQIHDVTIALDGQATTFRATVMDAGVKLAEGDTIATGMLLAWSGDSAQRILVVTMPHDTATDQAMALYLDGGDALRVAGSGTSRFSWVPTTTSCYYDTQPLLTGPDGSCLDGDASFSFSLTFGDGGAPDTVQFSSAGALRGVGVTRDAADFSRAGIYPALPLGLLPSR